jgi:hypothetical protein
MTLSNDGHVRYWHLAHIEVIPSNVRFWGKADIDGR